MLTIEKRPFKPWIPAQKTAGMTNLERSRAANPQQAIAAGYVFGVLFVPCRQVPGQEYGSRKEWKRKKLPVIRTIKRPGRRRKREGKRKIQPTGKNIVPITRNTLGRIVSSKSAETENDGKTHKLAKLQRHTSQFQ